VGTENFAIHVGKVSEIREYETPRTVPESVSIMVGVTEYRSGIIPVIDTGVKFGLKPVEITPQTCIVIIEVKRKDDESEFRIGILTDAVTDVFEVEEANLSKIKDDYSPDYIKATYKSDDNFYLILDSDFVFSENDIVEMGKVIHKIKK
jgi:purine-binding chemotaxis protein CheW